MERPSAARDRRAMVAALAEAFLDDPIWMGIGPRTTRRHRALANRASFWAIVGASHRHGGRLRVARSGPGSEIVGATIAFEPGTWPPPESSALRQIGWALVAGPVPVARGLRDDAAMRAAHPRHRHLYLWFVGVRSDHQGKGIGRALMADIAGCADGIDAPVFLETGTRSNVAFYRSLGYEVIGEAALPSGSEMWRMEHPGSGA